MYIDIFISKLQMNERHGELVSVDVALYFQKNAIKIKLFQQ